MADRATKLRRLSDFRRRMPYTSASALAAVLREVEQHGAPELNTRQALAAATELELCQDTPYGKMLVDMPLISARNAPMSIVAINPLGLLVAAYEQGGSFADLFDKAYAAKPATPEAPWELILYGDEVVLGNVVKYDNKRKIWIIYFSFQELGMIALQHEEAWFTLVVARSSVVNTVAAGISQVYGGAAKLFFGALQGNLQTGGIVFRRPNGDKIRFWAKLNMVLQDGGAHKSVWHAKVAGGVLYKWEFYISACLKHFACGAYTLFVFRSSLFTFSAPCMIYASRETLVSECACCAATSTAWLVI